MIRMYSQNKTANSPWLVSSVASLSSAEPGKTISTHGTEPKPPHPVERVNRQKIASQWHREGELSQQRSYLRGANHLLLISQWSVDEAQERKYSVG